MPPPQRPGIVPGESRLGQDQSTGLADQLALEDRRTLVDGQLASRLGRYLNLDLGSAKGQLKDRWIPGDLGELASFEWDGKFG